MIVHGFLRRTGGFASAVGAISLAAAHARCRSQIRARRGPPAAAFMAGLWTEICVAMPVIHAVGEGWDVTFVTDASGGVSHEAHDLAVRRMIAAGRIR
jgi:hypothetical protein